MDPLNAVFLLHQVKVTYLLRCENDLSLHILRQHRSKSWGFEILTKRKFVNRNQSCRKSLASTNKMSCAVEVEAPWGILETKRYALNGFCDLSSKLWQNESNINFLSIFFVTVPIVDQIEQTSLLNFLEKREDGYQSLHCCSHPKGQWSLLGTI